jgi:hypothetical protein
VTNREDCVTNRSIDVTQGSAVIAKQRVRRPHFLPLRAPEILPRRKKQARRRTSGGPPNLTVVDDRSDAGGRAFGGNVEGRVRMLRFEGLRELRDQLGAKAGGAFNDKPVSLCS